MMLTVVYHAVIEVSVIFVMYSVLQKLIDSLRVTLQNLELIVTNISYSVCTSCFTFLVLNL